MELLNRCLRVEYGRPATFEIDWRHVYAPTNLSNVHIMADGQKPVSSTATFPTTVLVGPHRIEVGGINGVGTEPEYRGNGFGRRVVRHCQASIRRQGLDIGLLSTEIPDWYRPMGWECCGEQCTFTLDRTSISYLPRIDNMTVRGWSESDVQGMHALYERQAGALRSLDLRRSFLGRTGIQGWVAHREADLVAYAIAIRGEVVEVRGELDHALGLLREIYPQALFGRQQYLLINLPAKRDVLSRHLRRLGLPMSDEYLGMIWIANARSLLQKVAPRIVVDREEEDVISLRDQDDQMTVSRRELVKLCFGPERRSEFAGDLLPIPLFQYLLDRV
jgi:GNAT superfamily N-acetyltransferase